MTDLGEKLTIFIPTFNRPLFLRRVLGHYDTLRTRIVVADSSDKPDEGIGTLFPNVEYTHTTNPEYRNKFLEATRRIDTPYFLIAADDDFVLRSAITRSIAFLSAHPDFSSAQGQQANFHTEPSDRIAFSLRYPWQYLDHVTFPHTHDTDVLTRINRIFRSELYLPWVYGVHRSDVLLLARELYDRLEEDFYFDFLWAFAVASRGSFAVLPFLFCARHQVTRTPRWKLFALLDSDRLEDRARLSRLYTTLASILADRHGVGLARAIETVEDGLTEVARYMVEKRRKKGYVRAGLASRRSCPIASCATGACAHFPEVNAHPVLRENHTLLGIEQSATCIARFASLFPLFDPAYEDELLEIAGRVLKTPGDGHLA